MEEEVQNDEVRPEEVDSEMAADGKSAETVAQENDKQDDEEDSEEEYVPQHVLDGGRDYRVEGNDVSGYIGVDPEYMTYSNPGEKPILTDAEKWDYTNQLDHLEGNMDGEDEQASSDQDVNDVNASDSDSDVVAVDVHDNSDGDSDGDAVPHDTADQSSGEPVEAEQAGNDEAAPVDDSDKTDTDKTDQSNTLFGSF